MVCDRDRSVHAPSRGCVPPPSARRKKIFLRLHLLRCNLFPEALASRRSPDGGESRRFALAVLAAGSLALTAALAVLFIQAIFVGIFVAQQWDRNFPTALLLVHHLRILAAVEDPREWTDVGRRRRIVDRLEEIATCIEHDWVKGWAVDDIHTQSWIHDIGFKIAASYRSLKMWIMTPKADTRDRLIDRVKQQKLALLNGDWDSLRRGDPPPVIEENRLRDLSALLRNMAIALLPISSLWAARWLHLDVSIVPAGAWWMCYVWLIVGLLLVLDPKLSSRTEAVRAAF